MINFQKNTGIVRKTFIRNANKNINITNLQINIGAQIKERLKNTITHFFLAK